MNEVDLDKIQIISKELQLKYEIVDSEVRYNGGWIPKLSVYVENCDLEVGSVIEIDDQHLVITIRHDDKAIGTFMHNLPKKFDYKKDMKNPDRIWKYEN